jgi:hypothetical protein
MKKGEKRVEEKKRKRVGKRKQRKGRKGLKRAPVC